MGYRKNPLSAAAGDRTTWDIVYTNVSCRRRLHSMGYNINHCQLQQEIAQCGI